jgi:hypothetical protein
MRPFRPLLAAALCVAAAAPAQTEPVDEASSVLLSRLRARDLSVADVAAIAGELAGRDTRTRLSASDTLRTIYAQRDKSHQRARDKLLTRIAELAAAVQKQALQKKGAARVDLLRDEVLALSRGEDLSKERIHADIDPRTFAIAIALAASASFLTPIGYQTNTMVYGLGGYRFADYARLGAPVTLTTLVLLVVLL